MGLRLRAPPGLHAAPGAERGARRGVHRGRGGRVPGHQAPHWRGPGGLEARHPAAGSRRPAPPDPPGPRRGRVDGRVPDRLPAAPALRRVRPRAHLPLLGAPPRPRGGRGAGSRRRRRHARGPARPRRLRWRGGPDALRRLAGGARRLRGASPGRAPAGERAAPRRAGLHPGARARARVPGPHRGRPGPDPGGLSRRGGRRDADPPGAGPGQGGAHRPGQDEAHRGRRAAGGDAGRRAAARQDRRPRTESSGCITGRGREPNV